MKLTSFRNIGATYKREVVEKPKNKLKFYAIIMFFSVILFVLFGIRPIAITTAENKKVLSELNDIEKLLETKLVQLVRETEKMNKLGEQLDILYIKIPQEELLEDYLSELVLAAAKHGFAVQRFRRQDSSDIEGIPLEIQLTGNIFALPKFINAMEHTSRFTTINTIQTELKEEGHTNVNLELTIFTL